MFKPVLNLTLTEIILLLIVSLILELPRAILKAVILLKSRSRNNPSKVEVGVKPEPEVSLIVPAHNEGEVIETTINSLIDLDYPRKEIIDDDSKDDTYISSSFSMVSCTETQKISSASGYLYPASVSSFGIILNFLLKITIRANRSLIDREMISEERPKFFQRTLGY